MNRVLALSPLALALVSAMVLPVLPVLQDPEKGDPEIQDPPEEQEEPELTRDIFGRLRAREAGSDGLDGMWQLMTLDAEGYPPDGLEAKGYLLISKGFVAFQMHATYDLDSTDVELLSDGYQTFMAEYELIGGDRMVCTNMIGSYLEEEFDDLEFEPSGFTREFTLERTGRLLTLKWDDGDSMTFGPRLHARTRLESIYGEQGGERSGRGADIFGREGKSGTGDDEDDEDDGGGR